MTVHVLHAGDGYAYLTDQVASGDVKREQGESLSEYYMQSGNPPGVWVGGGLGALGISGQVSEAQMRALFGEGLHPDADRMIAEAVVGGAAPAAALKAARLGRRFPVFQEVEADVYPERLAAAYRAFALEHDRTPEVGAERDELRRQVAQRILTERDGGQVPTSADVAHYLATRGAERRQAVAGYDLVFTPVKSVSTLWALADDATRTQISEAHEAAWRTALAWVEQEGALTRVGAAGVGQINTTGLVATAFDHLDSRTGDPNLHTHVAVSTKVQGVDGVWRSLDGRVLHALGVAASERYNTEIEAQLRARLGARFVGEGREGKRPVREIAGVAKEVRQAFSRRRDEVEGEYHRLLAQYRTKHGREAPRTVQYKLAQQATLATRRAKEKSGGLAQRLPEWRQVAERVLGGREGVRQMLRAALAGDPEPIDPAQVRDLETVDELAVAVVGALGERRSTWNRWHVAAEAERVVRASRRAEEAGAGSLPGVTVRELVDAVTDRALGSSVQLTPGEAIPAPAVLQRGNGESIYRVHGAERFTSGQVLASEDRLLVAAQSTGGVVVDDAAFAAALARIEGEKGRALNAGQRGLAAHFATSGRRVAAGIGPAGTGKTTAMSVFARAVEAAGGRVVGLAPSAAAAAVLGDELDVAAETLHKLLDAHRRAEEGRGEVPETLRVDAATVLLVDEAGMAGTPGLVAVLDLAERAGASVRLLGDPSQLAAVGAGGALRLIDHYVGAAQLEEVHRFLLADGKTVNEDEARASLQLRDGDPAGLAYYIENDRTRGGVREAMIEEVYAAWMADTVAGDSAIMVAATNDVVVELNARARRDRVIAGQVEEAGVQLHDGSRAGVGDVIVTRRNDRRLRTGPSDYVKNGDLWRVTRQHRDGSLSAVHRETRATVTFPAAYVGEWVELGYAATVHRVQGMTVAAGHLLVDETMTRNYLYTGATRGRFMNRLYVVTDAALDVDLHAQPDPARAVEQTLAGVLASVDEAPAALEALVTEWDSMHSLAQLVPAYEDAYTRLLEPAARTRIAETVRQVLPEPAAAAVMADSSYAQLESRLLEAERTEHRDIATVLEAAIASDPRPLDQAKWPARALRARIGEVTTSAEVSLPAWITQPPVIDAAPTADVPGDGDVVDEVAHGATEVPAVRKAKEISAAAWQWWQDQRGCEGSWAAVYLTERNLAVAAEAGWAPPSWDALTAHLRGSGYSDDALVAAGVATRTRDGRVVDRFRDRLVMPIRDAVGDVVGVTARVNPAVRDELAPKYLNTPETPAFSKRRVLHGWDADAAARLAAGARAVFVEGPMDVAAIKALGQDDLVPLAPCGTALTDAQLDLVRGAGGDLGRAVFAFDGDAAGRAATVRAWEHLHPSEAAMAGRALVPGGKDPAELIEQGRPGDLDSALRWHGSLTEAVVDEVLAGNDVSTPERALAVARHLGSALARLPENPEVDAYTSAAFGDRLAPETVREALSQARQVDTPLSPRGDTDESVREWLGKQAHLINDRLDALVADVESPTPPAWARQLYRPPVDPATLATWRTAIRSVAAYRDRYAITGTDPLGPDLDDGGVRQHARASAAAALASLTPARPPAPAAPEEAQQIEVLRRREQLAALRERLRSPQVPQQHPRDSNGLEPPPPQTGGPSIGL